MSIRWPGVFQFCGLCAGPAAALQRRVVFVNSPSYVDAAALLAQLERQVTGCKAASVHAHYLPDEIVPLVALYDRAAHRALRVGEVVLKYAREGNLVGVGEWHDPWNSYLCSCAPQMVENSIPFTTVILYLPFDELVKKCAGSSSISRAVKWIIEYTVMFKGEAKQNGECVEALTKTAVLKSLHWMNQQFHSVNDVASLSYLKKYLFNVLLLNQNEVVYISARYPYDIVVNVALHSPKAAAHVIKGGAQAAGACGAAGMPRAYIHPHKGGRQHCVQCLAALARQPEKYFLSDPNSVFEFWDAMAACPNCLDVLEGLLLGGTNHLQLGKGAQAGLENVNLVKYPNTSPYAQKPYARAVMEEDVFVSIDVFIYCERIHSLVVDKSYSTPFRTPLFAKCTLYSTVQEYLLEEIGIKVPFTCMEYVRLKFTTNECSHLILITMSEEPPHDPAKFQFLELTRTDKTAGNIGEVAQILRERYLSSEAALIASLDAKVQRFIPLDFDDNYYLAFATEADKDLIGYAIEICKVIETIFMAQILENSLALAQHLHSQAAHSSNRIHRLRALYFKINKSPWSVVDDFTAFLTSRDAPFEKARDVHGKVHAIRMAIPRSMPTTANVYPLDLDKEELEKWEEGGGVTDAVSVLRRKSRAYGDLGSVPYGTAFEPHMKAAARFCRLAQGCAQGEGLVKYFHSLANAFSHLGSISEWHTVDEAWVALDGPLDVCIAPFYPYRDRIATKKQFFQGYVGIRDATSMQQVAKFALKLPEINEKYPLASKYKRSSVNKAKEIRVINLLYTSGDIMALLPVGYALPPRRASKSVQIVIKNVSEMKFIHIMTKLCPIVIEDCNSQFVQFGQFLDHTLCHEVCHSVQPSTYLNLSDNQYAFEECKSDILGLWAQHHFQTTGDLPEALEATYYTFLVGCIRSIRFGITEPHARGRCMIFNFFMKEGAFVFGNSKWRCELSRCFKAAEQFVSIIMGIMAFGGAESARKLVEEYCILGRELQITLQQIEESKIPVDVFPVFNFSH